jgi:hypothetical protein
MNTAQPIIAPPFSTKAGVSSIPQKPKDVSSKQWNDYMKTYNYAKEKGDSDPRTFADNVAEQSNWFKTKGKNNLLDEKANKDQPGNVVNNNKYKNFESLDNSLNVLYSELAKNKAADTTLKGAQQEIGMQEQAPQPIQGQQGVDVSQPIAQDIPQAASVQQSAPINIPQNVGVLDENTKIQSDQTVQGLNSIQDMQAINPHAYGGPIDPLPMRPEEREKSMERYKLLRASAIRGSGVKSDYKPDLRTQEQIMMDYQYLRDSIKPGFNVDSGYRPIVATPDQVQIGYNKLRNNGITEYALGGPIGNTYEGGGNLNTFRTGSTHENNPYGGIPLGTGSNGKMNTVEQDETSYNIKGQKFIFSNRIKL